MEPVKTRNTEHWFSLMTCYRVSWAIYNLISLNETTQNTQKDGGLQYLPVIF